jgi:protein SCO1/2
MRKFLFILTLVLIVVTTAQLWLTQDRTLQTKLVDDNAGEGAAQIGGAFTLTDQNGNLVHESDFRGRVMMVFFGFTSCPDICPVAVASMSKAMEILGSKADQVAPIFISVDPERDTPSVLKTYLAPFDKRFVGLTGTPDQIKEVSDLYKAYLAKKDIAPKDGTYTVDHSAYIYLMGKDGKYRVIFPNTASGEDLARALERALGS